MVVCMLRICLSAGCFLQVRVMGWRFHGLTLTFPARTCPQIFLVLWVSMWCPPSPPQCFDFSYSFFLEMDGSRCQDFKYIVWMERRKGIELLGWEVITAPFKLGFWCILSVQSNCQEFPFLFLFFLLFPSSSLVLKNVLWNAGIELLYQNVSFRRCCSTGLPQKKRDAMEGVVQLF